MFDSYRGTLLAQLWPERPALLDEIAPLLDKLEVLAESQSDIKNLPVTTDNFATDREHGLDLSLCSVDREAKAINPPGKDKLQMDSARDDTSGEGPGGLEGFPNRTSSKTRRTQSMKLGGPNGLHECLGGTNQRVEEAQEGPLLHQRSFEDERGSNTESVSGDIPIVEGQAWSWQDGPSRSTDQPPSVLMDQDQLALPAQPRTEPFQPLLQTASIGGAGEHQTQAGQSAPIDKHIRSRRT
jgi:hypothetical protein